MLDLIITDEILQGIARSEGEFCKRVRRCDPMEGARNLASGYKERFSFLEHITHTDKLSGLKVLEVGSGNGFLLTYALKNGVNIIGIEPGKSFGFQDRYLRAIRLMQINGIQNPMNYLIDASAENIPFDSNTFDVVFSIAVLEHVQSVELSMRESIRVLKPGGILFGNVPNYNSFYEGHYNILWIPYMNRTHAKIYVEKYFNRDQTFIDELNFTTPSMFERYLDSSVTHGKIFLSGLGPLSYIFSAYNACMDASRLRKPDEHEGLRKILVSAISSKIVKQFLAPPLLVACNLLQLFGFATTFDIILYKKTIYNEAKKSY